MRDGRMKIGDMFEARERWEAAEANYQELLFHPETFSEDERVSIITARDEIKAAYIIKRDAYRQEYRPSWHYDD